MQRLLIAASMVLFTAPMVHAHEGHGHPEHTDGILHYVVNPSHSVVGLCVALLFSAAIVVARRLLKKRALKQVAENSASTHIGR